MNRHVYLFDFLSHPYEEVRDLLRDRPTDIFAHADQEAALRTDELLATLGVPLGKTIVGRSVLVELDGFEERSRPFPIAKLPLRWRAAELPALFPSMEADLEAYPLSRTETQVSLLGRYRPPLGPLGSLVDAALLHRVAQASLQRFFRQLLGQMQVQLDGRPVSSN